MSIPNNPIRSCLDSIRNGKDLASAMGSFPAEKGDSLEKKTNDFVTRLFENANTLQDKDLEVLSKIHADPILTPELSKKIFLLCLTHLGDDVSAESTPNLPIVDIENLETRKEILKSWHKDVLILESMLPTEISPEERFHLSAAILQNLTDITDRKTLLYAISCLPIKNRTSFLKASIVLTKGITNSAEKKLIIEQVYTFSPRDYYEVASKIAVIVNPFDDKKSLIPYLSNIEESSFEDQIKDLGNLLENLHDTEAAKKIITKYKELYRSGNVTAIKNTLLLSKGDPDPNSRLELLNKAYGKEIPKEVLSFLSVFSTGVARHKALLLLEGSLPSDVLPPIATLLSSFRSEKSKLFVLENLIRTSAPYTPHQFLHHIQQSVIYFPVLCKFVKELDLNEDSHLTFTLSAVFSSPPVKWKQLCNNYLELFRACHPSIDKKKNFYSFLETIVKAPLKHEPLFMELNKKILPYLDDPNDLLLVLKYISYEPLEGLAQFSQTLKVFEPYLKELEDRKTVILNLSEIDMNKRADLINFISSVTSVLLPEEITQLIKDASSISFTEMATLGPWCLPLLTKLPEETRMEALGYLSLIPVVDRRDDVLNLIENLANINPHFNEHYAYLGFIAPDKRVDTLKKILELIRTGFITENAGEFISLLFEDPDLCAKSHQYLLNEIHSNPHKAEVRAIINGLISVKDVLKISSSSALYQSALFLQSTSKKDEYHLKDPYTVYAKLLKQQTTKLNIKPSAETVDGIKVQFSNRHFIEELEKSKARATFDTLPPHINSELLKSYFRVLKERIASLPEDKKVATLTEIYNQTGLSLEALETNLAKDPYINGLLDKTGTKDMKVPPEIVELKALIEDLETLSNEVKDSDLLSQREEALIQMSNSIQHCPGGKREGIASLYRIRKEMPLSLSSHASDPYGKANAYVTSLVTQWMNTSISEDGPFMRQLTKVPSSAKIGQLSHQAIYIKNLIAKHIGLDWQLTFDIHTMLLYDTLVARTSKEILTLFFKYHTPSSLLQNFRSHVDKVLKDLNSEDKDKQKEAAALYHMLSKLMSDEPSIWELTETFDEETATFANSCKITESGALKVLLKIGILEEPSTPSAAG